jgi:hypothetical protein
MGWTVAAKKKTPAKKTAPKRKKPRKLAGDPMVAFLAQGREVTPTSVTYMLRCCDADMSSRNGFKWPESGPVEAPDWKPRAECGNGLHGWLMGVGDIDASTYWQDADAKWLVCAVWSADVVDLDAKVKAPRAWVVFCGDAKKAGAEMVRLGAAGPVIHGTATAGYGGTATAGIRGTATAGEDGVIVIRYWNGSRYKLKVANVGEGGIEPNRPYRLQADGTFVRVDQP